MQQKRRSFREPDDDDGDIGQDLAAVNERLDALTRQLERIAQANAEPRPAGAAFAHQEERADERTDRVSDALGRLDRRLDQVIAESRASDPAGYAPPQQQQQFTPPHPSPGFGPANWAAQIAARQRALDSEPAAAPAVAPAAPANWGPAPDLSGLEQQLHHINTQISSLHQPYAEALNALRNDLADIGRALTEAMPRQAIEALEGEVRALAERVDHTRQAGVDGAALGSLERELAEVRDALHNLTPAESLAGFEEAVRSLDYKIDQLAAGQSALGDPMAFKQLEQAVVSLRGVVANVASDGALAQLAAEVRALSSQLERATAESSTEALGKLEARIASLMESGRAVPLDLEGSIRALSERLDRVQLSQGDQLALGTLEDRIAKLSEKLDVSDSRLGHLEAIERGLGDLLVYLEEIRNGGPRGLRAPPSEPAPAPTAPPRVPETPAQAPAEFARSPLDLIPELPAHHAPPMAPAVPKHTPEPAFMPPPPPMPPPPAPVTFAPPPPAPMAPEPAARPSAPQMPPAPQMPRGPQRQPIDPHLPPDTPLEPGSGAPRLKPGSAAARIAASEAALGNIRPMAAETGGKWAAIAAARNAAKAAYLDTPVKVPKSLSDMPHKWLKWPFKKAAKELPLEPQFPAAAPPSSAPAMPAAMASTMPPPLPVDEHADAPLSRGKKILKLLKTLLIAASVAIIVVGVAQTALEYLLPDPASDAPAPLPPKDQSQSPAQPNAQAPATAPSRPMPASEGTWPAPSGTDPDSTNSISRSSSFFDPSTAVKLPEVTGSIPQKPAPTRAPGSTAAGQSNSDTFPASISPALRIAAAANDPAAEYELGSRYAEGRGVPQSMPEAVRWFERAAGAGFAPAQFRLASINEKGDGVRKDVQAARRFYLAAAGKGHAKAMHNLAVLYAEGIEGKPDYKAASEWFRKAAGYGVTDSQYNLAILYARGIGVQTNLAESYRWFALAAANGDTDAAKKRDEVGARLDQNALTTAKLAAQGFIPEREPDEATSLKAPPGGWDHAPAAAAKPRRQAPASRAPLPPASTTR